MKILAQISRFLVGVLFIISGFIKANDPLGFSYKLDEYFGISYAMAEYCFLVACDRDMCL
ncbi:MAG: hypothetical protein IPG90_09880 [Bacteroidetes bacterium]|nr:hypothetical protein [Bacteroidota bacterium]